ncbi:glycosyltransferase family 2 protein [uncultured Pseudokineococcus sp.]|uniref:glycosyltransferase family 2 protein n=1 Tax=uncultured Pseudokineococcus sp. TaxID=1642928 RepID=UPI0026077F88|nr:glycosyltransferase family 2 protein [uncultured Pseudokineococcus sp.]
MAADHAGSTAPAPEVSVIVPVHGDRGGLRSTLEHLAAQRTRRTFEVVVADNGDNGDVEALAASIEGLDVRVVEEPRRGSYAARNTGVGVARGAVLAFTDADCLPRPTWLEAGLALLEREGPGVFVGGGVVVVPSRPSRPSLAELWQIGHDLRQDAYLTRLHWSATANLFVRRDDYDRVGPFDGSLESSGDKEWGQRARTRAVRAVYGPEAVIDHPARPTMKVLLAKRRRIVRGTLALSRSTGVPVYSAGTLRSLKPLLRDTWRESAQRVPRPVDRPRLLGVTAFVHLYQRWYVARLRAQGR